MKKLKQIITACCLFIGVASMVFMTTAADAQNNSKENPIPVPNIPCCAYAGPNITVSGCTSGNMGPANQCPTGWNCVGSRCATTPNYSWAPTTYLTCPTCSNTQWECHATSSGSI